ncbi:MAG: hypothetical protein SynsKO_07900 [Synoicihabitans sp.]
MDGGGGRFAGLDFPAGKLPLARKVFVHGTLGDQDFFILFDEGAADGNRWGGVWNADGGIEDLPETDQKPEFSARGRRGVIARWSEVTKRLLFGIF